MTIRHIRTAVFCGAVLMASAGFTGCLRGAGSQGEDRPMVTHIELTEREKTIAGFSGDMIAVMELAFPTGCRQQEPVSGGMGGWQPGWLGHPDAGGWGGKHDMLPLIRY